MSLSPVKQPTAMRPSYNSASKNTAISTPGRKTIFSKVREIPLEHDAQYTISYVPGMSEHGIETGKTFEEARMKVVLLTCELERISTYNYSLVRENEVLRIQANKSEREKDLETKLAIVLAENEKLNQIIEDVYDAYMSTRGLESNEEYERRLAEVYHDLEEWKSRCHALEDQVNVVQLQNELKELQNRNQTLSEQLARKERDFEAMKARISHLEPTVPHTNNGDLQQQLAVVNAENNSLKKELEAMKLKYGNANELQLKLAEYNNKMKVVLDENNKLNDLVKHKVNEIEDLKAKLDQNKHTTQALKSPQSEQKKSTVRRGDDELENALNEVEHLRQENQRLLNSTSSVNSDQKAAVERLSLKVKELIQQNDNLNRLAEVKSNEVNSLLIRIRELEAKSSHSEDANRRSTYLADESKHLREQLEQKKKEIESLYVRIAEIQQSNGNVGEYKEKLLVLAKENQRLNDIVHAKLEEVESLRAQIRDSQVNSGQYNDLHSKLVLVSSENERLYAEIERLKKSSFESTRRPDLEAIIAQKDREIESLKNDHVRMVDSHVSEFNRQTEALKSAGVDQKRKINELEGRISQLIALENRVNYLTMESERLHKEIIERDSQINSLTVRMSEKDRELNDYKVRVQSAEALRQHEAEELRARLSIELERKFISIREELEVQIRKLTVEKKEIEDRGRYNAIELERVQDTIKNLRAESEEWKSRYYQIQGSNDREVDELRKQFESLRSTHLEAKDLQFKFAAERTAYETQILQMSQIINDLEHKVQIVSTENERMVNLSVQRLNVIEELKKNSNEETHKLEIYELRSQLDAFKASSYDVKQLALQYNSERAADQAKINELTQLNSNLRADLEKLKELIERRKADFDSLNRQNEDLRRMCEKLSQQTKVTTSSVNVESIELLQTKISELEMSRTEYQRQAERNALELTRKNRELVDKIQELDILKLKYEEALANYQALNSQVFARLSTKK